MKTGLAIFGLAAFALLCGVIWYFSRIGRRYNQAHPEESARMDRKIAQIVARQEAQSEQRAATQFMLAPIIGLSGLALVYFRNPEKVIPHDFAGFLLAGVAITLCVVLFAIGYFKSRRRTR